MRLCALLFLLTCSGVAFAQELTGRITDSEARPLPYANVVQLSVEDSVFIQGTVTGDDGLFSMPVMDNNVILKVSCVGYKTQFVNYKGQGEVDVQMMSDTELLGEAMVIGRRMAYKQTSGGVTAKIENSVMAKLGTAEDVLVKMPGVVKKKDKFEVFGKGNPLIFIDGRQVRDESELNRLKADGIRDVEIITNPGAKYDASVMAVVKIRTLPSAGDGLGIDATSIYYQSENMDICEMVSWNYRKKRTDVFGTFDYTLTNGYYPAESNSTLESDTLWNQHFFQDYSTKEEYFRTILGLNQGIGEHGAIGVRYTITARPSHDLEHSMNSEIKANGLYYDNLDNTLFTSTSYKPNHLLNAYSNYAIGNTNIELNIDYLFNKKDERTKYDERSASQESRIVSTLSSERNALFAAKLTADFPFIKGYMSVGAEYSRTNRDDDYVNGEGYIPSSYSKLKESNFSPFIGYAKDIASVGHLTLGLRYENVNFDYYENGVRILEQSRSFENLFPNLSLATKIGSLQAQIGYSTRTRRPSYRQLSNNVLYGNRFLLQSGNPLLKHEYVHEVAFMGMWRFLRFAVSYTNRHHAIIADAFQWEGKSSVSQLSYTNVPSLESMMCSLGASLSVGVWSAQVQIGMKKQWFTMETEMGRFRMNTPVMQLAISNIIDFKSGWMLNSGAWVTSRGDDGNFSSKRVAGSLSVEVKKTWSDGRVSVSAKGSDLLHTEKFRNAMYAGQICGEQLNWSDSREFVLTLRYKFNPSKSKYMGTGAGNEEKERL